MTKINVKAINIGIKAGVISSSCCILPLVLVILGLGSIGTALKISQYRIYFIGLSLIFLISSLFLYFKKNKSCHAVNKKMFVGTAIITQLLIFILLFYALAPIIAQSVYSKSSTNTFVTKSSNTRKIVLEIDGMTCSSCAYGIEYQLKQLDGIIEANVSFSESIGEIIYDPSKISEEQIIKSKIFTAPYSAKIIKGETNE